ncbi:HD-GYP domain-containing protein [Butyrivibrio sp. CB08]|uniref:HD-GYP domain-containing protein n=1 Tax=Butyrivibrio sp. CB08 TaxID=2364879 RepID=UPI000EA92C01|nr:HD-GYP domain-containing protein [Butyrivibrio sp. CB08]RKM59208.1 HD-GYP domain-containing protein [Butyrivibrio sp. CB08]
MRNEKTKINFLYFILIALYLVASVFLPMLSRAEGVIVVPGGEIPIASFTGVLSSLTNLIVIFLVILYKKTGYITSLVFLVLQFPMQLRSFLSGYSAASIPGIFTNLFAIIAITIIYIIYKRVDRYQENQVKILTEQKNEISRLFDQTATALVNSIDAKDKYSHGHSIRVAEYSEMLARKLGKDEDECKKIYYAGLLHDVGKIGVPDAIINKPGKLTTDEYDIIKDHPGQGNQILNSIGEYPFLSIGAHYHHERYDGKGYPDGLKGDDIPEIARIISVADAYDAMSSNRSYRQAIPQQLIREEIVKGAGTQFDPKITKLMQYLIDADVNYDMREKAPVKELAGRNEIIFDEYRDDISDGVLLSDHITRIHLKSSKLKSGGPHAKGPSLILFDSLDGRVHTDEETARRLCFLEYTEIWLEGDVVNKGARNIETTFNSSEGSLSAAEDPEGAVEFDIEAVKVKDHTQITVTTRTGSRKTVIAMPDTSRYAYISLTGDFCHVTNVSISTDAKPVSEDYIKRIAEEITYIDGPVGDLPNLQIDGFRSASTEGVPLREALRFKFHTMSLPTARLIWHCPYLVIYSSDDGKKDGKNYREYALIRFDGENWDSLGISENRLIVNFNDDFEGWEAWKMANKKGYDANVSFKREGDVIVTKTKNHGVAIKNITTITDGTKNLYVYITGDQCALTNIATIY